MKIKEILNLFEECAPFIYQESYDNTGLQVGEMDADATGILITLDITEEVIEEARRRSCNTVLSHHPLIFGGIKSISGRNATERIIFRAVRESINILSVHTNLDNTFNGVNSKICDKLGLINRSILLPAENKLLKLSVFVPEGHVDNVREQIFKAGAGQIGNYDCCSFNIPGTGTFRGNEDSNPFIGQKGNLQLEKEFKIETILPVHLKERVIKAMIEAHPYEEVAFDLYPLANTYGKFGSGMTGYLIDPVAEEDFLLKLKNIFRSTCVKHSFMTGKTIKKVAVCGGAGSFLLANAIYEGADVFISADFKYHQFFEAEGKILIADIGHYESEQFTKEIFYEILIKKFPNFALHLSEINTNPIYYI